MLFSSKREQGNMGMNELAHMNALELSLSNERVRLVNSKSKVEREWREHNILMIEREIAGEIEFLKSHGLLGTQTADKTTEMTDEELLAELAA